MALSKLTLAPARTLLRQAARGMARKPIVGGNWKCNPATASSLDELVSNFDGCAQYLDKCDVYVCPSNLHVAMVHDKFNAGVMVSPQNCNFKVRVVALPNTPRRARAARARASSARLEL